MDLLLPSIKVLTIIYAHVHTSHPSFNYCLYILSSRNWTFYESIEIYWSWEFFPSNYVCIKCNQSYDLSLLSARSCLLQFMCLFMRGIALSVVSNNFFGYFMCLFISIPNFCFCAWIQRSLMCIDSKRPNMLSSIDEHYFYLSLFNI